MPDHLYNECQDTIIFHPVGIGIGVLDLDVMLTATTGKTCFNLHCAGSTFILCVEITKRLSTYMLFLELL